MIEPHEYGPFKGYAANPPVRKRNAWSYIDARDLGEIVRLCLEKDGLGFQVFNATNDTITLNIPTKEALKQVCAEDARHARDGRVRGAFVEPQDPRSARLQGGAQLAKTRERLNPALRQALGFPRVLVRHHTLAPRKSGVFRKSSADADLTENPEPLRLTSLS